MSRRVLPIGSFLFNSDRDIFNRYVPGSGVGATSIFARRAKLIKATRTTARYSCPICPIYLTYDDGPSEYTEAILDALALYGAKATFFVIGKFIEGNENLLIRMVNEGHEIGNHTWNHPSLNGVSKEVFVNEITLTQNKVFEITGIYPKLLRPPYGDMDTNTQVWAEELGLKITLWSVDTEDWKRPGTQNIVSSVINNSVCYSNVLMHDGGGDRSQTVEATRQILNYYSNKCFQLVKMPNKTICGFQLGPNCDPNL